MHEPMQDTEQMRDPLTLVQAMLERCEQARSIEQLRQHFQHTLEHLGFGRFVCSSHGDLLHPPPGSVVIHNYPAQWLSTYSTRRWHEVDPVFLHAERTTLPFFWDDPEFRDGLSPSQQRIMHSADAQGLAHGFTVPIHLPAACGGRRASCSVVPAVSAVPPRSFLALRLMAPNVYEAARRLQQPQAVRGEGVGLTRREWQCLELAARGKSDGAMARVLGLSEATVHKHIERAKRKLGVATRVQAIVAVLTARPIAPDRKDDAPCAGEVIFSGSRIPPASAPISC